ncbi:MAG: DegV family protein [Clostridia bacterium]|nr:DegV family protein [Clostridia bacterium]
MSKRIILSADSTCDLTPEIRQQYGVNLYPYHIILEGKSYVDNVDVSADVLYDAYHDRKVLPSTAAINVGEFIDYFKQWTDEGYEVVHINLSSGLSSSFQNARLAAEELGGVYVIDSKNLSTGVGHLVIEAGKLIGEGLEASEVAARLEEMVSKVHSSFILDTLEFMKAGGRCSATAAFGANLLKLKPLINVNNENGKMEVGKKYRGALMGVLEQYVGEKLDEYDNIRTDKIFITHSGIEQEYVDAVRRTIEEKKAFENIIVTRASCTISCHCGPRCLGILFMTK